jgi:predicted nucleotidyltransferase
MINSKQIDRIVSLIVNYYAPDQVLLFGSQAKGNAGSQSDIDLIVIKDTPIPKGQRGHDLSDGFANFPFKIDLVFLTKGELKAQLKADSSFVSSIWHNAKIIFEKP